MSHKMMQNPPTAAAPSTKVLKKLEKEITKNSKNDEQKIQVAIKELQVAEKEYEKAQKAANKTKEAFKKAEAKEIHAAKLLHEAEQKHTTTIVEMKNLEKVVKLDDETVSRVSQTVDQKRQQVETLLQEQAQKVNVRNESLTKIRSGKVPDVMPA